MVFFCSCYTHITPFCGEKASAVVAVGRGSAVKCARSVEGGVMQRVVKVGREILVLVVVHLSQYKVKYM